MGMFDTIEYQGQQYQTKDLECFLTRYSVTDDGRLLYHGLGSDVPPMDMEYHGIINIYNDDSEYRLKFTDGRLVQVDEIKDIYE